MKNNAVLIVAVAAGAGLLYLATRKGTPVQKGTVTISGNYQTQTQSGSPGGLISITGSGYQSSTNLYFIPPLSDSTGAIANPIPLAWQSGGLISFGDAGPKAGTYQAYTSDPINGTSNTISITVPPGGSSGAQGPLTPQQATNILSGSNGAYGSYGQSGSYQGPGIYADAQGFLYLVTAASQFPPP